MGKPRQLNVRMSSSDYFDLHTEKQKPLIKSERRKIWDRLAKKYLRARGYIGPKIPAIWAWEYLDQNGSVTAHTLSEAKSQVKKLLGVSKKARLPKEAKVIKC